MRRLDRLFAIPLGLLLACSGGAAEKGSGASAPGGAGAAEASSGGAPAAPPEEVTFPSEDGLEITADLYRASEAREAPFIVLFHQAGWSRGAYREIAPRLSRLGYNCLAIDARSGKEANGVKNETAARAREAGKGTSYIDALPDLRAALAYARERYAGGPLLAWGSSYSAALVLRIAGESPDLVDGVLAFSPGEYFEKLDKPMDWIEQSAAKIEDEPVFITSARGEEESWSAIYEAIPSEAKTSFLPETAGNHGSRALFSEFDDSRAYWQAVEAFLAEHFPAEPR